MSERTLTADFSTQARSLKPYTEETEGYHKQYQSHSNKLSIKRFDTVDTVVLMNDLTAKVRNEKGEMFVEP